MSRYLLDTDHLTLYYHGHAALLAHLSRHVPGEIALSVVTAEESLKGRLAILSRKLDSTAHVQAYANLLATIRLLHQLPIAPFDAACEQCFQQLLSLRLGVGKPDLKIAATALVQGLIVVTRNRRDFGRVPGLTIEDWSAP